MFQDHLDEWRIQSVPSLFELAPGFLLIGMARRLALVTKVPHKLQSAERAARSRVRVDARQALEALARGR